MSRNSLRYLFILAFIVLSAAAAFAGGPLIINPDTKTPYAYSGTVLVHYDNGNLATNTWNWHVDPATQVTLDNSVGKHMVEKGYGDWSAIPSSSFRATVVGNFASIGLPDINGSNAGLVIGNFNGGGVDVIFDADGTVLSDFLGAPPGVLGVSSPEFGEDGTSIITESWTILNGQGIDGADTDGSNYQGVATHEFGHSVNLAHTQTNGSAYFYAGWDFVGPASCTSSLPYSSDLTKDDVETMYPYSDPTVGGTGLAQANIHTSDDIAAISNLYPGPGWPRDYGTIKGTIYATDGKTPLTGVNVIARDLADPYSGGSSTMSGEWTQGLFGPDGSYVIHGLKPGAKYVVYVDAIFAGGFPTEPLWFLPGPERFYNGVQKKNADTFTSCQYQVITASAGSTKTANIQFEQIKGAPVVTNLGYGTFASDVSGDGSVVMGSYGRGTPIFRWTARSGLQQLPNVYASDANVFISKSGQYIATNLVDTNNVDQGSHRWDAKNGWVPVKSKLGSCDNVQTYTWGVADDGSVFGMGYQDCTSFRGFKWNPSAGMKLLPTATKKADGTPSNSRPNRVSATGSTVVGWEESMVHIAIPPEFGGGSADFGPDRTASFIAGGVPRQILDAEGTNFDEASAVSSDGTVIGGSAYFPTAPVGAGWFRKINDPELTYLGPLADNSSTTPLAFNHNGSLILGFSGNPFFDFNAGPFIYTKQLGTVSLNDFLRRQGASMETIANSAWTPMAMSDDGSVIVGWAYGPLANFGWVAQMPKAFVCHAPPGNPHAAHTISVPFPAGMDLHLEHGDTVGPCHDFQ